MCVCKIAITNVYDKVRKLHIIKLIDKKLNITIV